MVSCPGPSLSPQPPSITTSFDPVLMIHRMSPLFHSDTPATPDHLTQTDLLPDLLAAVSSSSHVARSKAPAATEPPKHGHPDVGPSTYGVSQEIPRNAAAKTPVRLGSCMPTALCPVVAVL